MRATSAAWREAAGIPATSVKEQRTRMNTVLFVEASSGGVLGGSLTGLYHLIRGMDRTRFRIGMALYEEKPIEAELARLDIALHHMPRRRLPTQHDLLQLDRYHQAKLL